MRNQKIVRGSLKKMPCGKFMQIKFSSILCENPRMAIISPYSALMPADKKCTSVEVSDFHAELRSVSYY